MVQLTPKLLNYVVTIAEERNISNAAKRLYLSQPSLSQSIISLEKSLGVALFDRSTIPLGLTDAGEIFVEAAIKILSTERELLEQLNDISQNGASNIVIGISSFRNSTIIPHVLPVFRRMYPNVRIKIIEDTNDAVKDMLEKGIVDLAFVTDTINRDLIYEKIFSDRAVLVLSRDHPLCRQYTLINGDYPVIDLQLLKDETFTLLVQKSHIRKIAEKIFDDNHFLPCYVIETTNMDMAHRMATSAVSASIIQESLLSLYLPEQLGCYYRFPNQDYLTDLYICYRKNFRLTKSMSHFIRITGDIIQKKQNNLCP